MNTERWKEIEGMPLAKGNHKAGIKDGGCIMELVSYLANEPWSDSPECACPVLTRYAIRLNDAFRDKHRQLMKPFIPLLLDTRSTDTLQIKRKQMLMFRNVTATYPLILDLIKMPELAEKLRQFKNSVEDMKAAAAFLNEHKEAIRKTADAYANAYANVNAYANANANANANAYANAYAYAYAYAYVNVNAYADAYVNVNANAYVNAYADAYANALKDKIAVVALESLRMAIEVVE